MVSDTLVLGGEIDRIGRSRLPLKESLAGRSARQLDSMRRSWLSSTGTYGFNAVQLAQTRRQPQTRNCQRELGKYNVDTRHDAAAGVKRVISLPHAATRHSRSATGELAVGESENKLGAC